ncbi:hypothetical protein C8R43DRAFT_1116525 [Mycena crocata]|nr:hypothetical protein C8R43DRAFT_1116525 [Mycena crocata]
MDLLLRSTTLEESNPTPLPAELEREIFRLAAKICPQTAPTLLRVARRVLVWVEPLLYETLILDCSVDDSLHPSLRLVLETKPPDFFRQHVRNLFLGGAFRELDIILHSQFCPLSRIWTLLEETFPLPRLSTLTHLRVFLRRNSSMQEILSHCKNLHVVVNAFTDEMKFAEQPWKDGMEGGLSIWGEAELLIAKKRQGEIKPGS